jgi:hypothetical protein
VQTLQLLKTNADETKMMDNASNFFINKIVFNFSYSYGFSVTTPL